MTDAAWASYVQRFHDERAGITDAVLQGASDDESPYQWALQPVAAHGRVVDLACGSAPLHQLLAVPVCVGIDRSPAELDLAASSGAGPLVLADAGSIPLAAGVASVVVCSMSLQILQPLGPACAEVARLLRPDGVRGGAASDALGSTKDRLHCPVPPCSAWVGSVGCWYSRRSGELSLSEAGSIWIVDSENPYVSSSRSFAWRRTTS